MHHFYNPSYLFLKMIYFKLSRTFGMAKLKNKSKLKLLGFACFISSGVFTACSEVEDPVSITACVENCTDLSSDLTLSNDASLSSGVQFQIELSSEAGVSSANTISSSSDAGPAEAIANFESLLSEAQFNSFFPNKNEFYTYQGFVDAVAAMDGVRIKLERRTELNYEAPQVSKWDGSKWVVLYAHVDFNQSWNLSKEISSIEVDFGDFLSVGTVAQRKEELMAFLAQLSHETTGRGPEDPMNGGLWFKEEVEGRGYTESNDANFQAVSGQSYHGRGPFQISYPYNYGKFSNEIYGNNEGLTRPAFVLDRPQIAFMAGIWFWMRPQQPKPSMHEIMIGTAVDTKGVNGDTSRFGWTTHVINGGLECGIGGNLSSIDRQNYFKYYMSELGLTPEDNLSCAQMTRY